MPICLWLIRSGYMHRYGPLMQIRYSGQIRLKSGVLAEQMRMIPDGMKKDRSFAPNTDPISFLADACGDLRLSRW